MRLDSNFFETDNLLGSKDPRYVIGIDFDGSIQYLTSHDDIVNVPGSPILDVIQGISATSQTLNPDKANATIGSMTFDIVDLANAFTDKVRTELDTNDVGLRGRTVTFHMGYKSENDGAGILDGSSTDDNPDFDNFTLFQTQIINSVQTREGRYSVSCADIQRETKKQIFNLALTYLTSSITDVATTIAVLDVSNFEGNFHGTSYTDAPSVDVIYIKIDQTKEIIRCPVSGISGNSFTGVTRGVLGSDAQAVEVDVTKASDRRPKVEEFVYLELPAVKLAYAILTGVIEGTANVLPSNWHAGVPTAFVRLTDFQNIGDDLWVTSDDTAGVVLRFEGLDKQDAKSFLETELYLLLGLFSPVYADGQLGLKRMVPSLSDSPFIFTVDDDNVSSTGNLTHDMESMQNNLRIDWNWNGERFIRSTIVLDSASVTRHGKAPEKRMGFRGLASTRFTEQVLRQLLTSLRDMYTGPPLRLPVSGFHLMNKIEVGDACRVTLSNIRDYTQAGASLDRTMVVHGMTVDWLQGVKLKLFGSAERADEIPPVIASQCLLDAFYAQEGTALNSIGGLMTGNVTNSGTFTLVGSADMNAAASIFYHDAPLTIASATTLEIEGNVQLRVRGFLTIDGTIDGTGNGHPTDTNLFDLDQHYFWRDDEQSGTPGFIGNCAAHPGLLIRTNELINWVWITGAFLTTGRFDAFPNIILQVSDSGSGSITGIPTDMRGSGGAYGNRAGQKIGIQGRTHQKATGGAGGAGGSALCIVCRGGDFGAGGQITLDGDDGLEPTTFYTVSTYHIYGGAGGAGSPGALLWLIDGSAQTFPDLAGHFQAKTGVVPAQFALPFLDNPFGQNRNLDVVNAPLKNMAPFMPVSRISDYDQSGVNFRISFLPCDVAPEEDQGDIVPPTTGLAAGKVLEGIILTWNNPPAGQFDHIEIHRSDENVRSTATVIATTKAESFVDVADLVAKRTLYYWSRAVDADGNVSSFDPDTSTTGATTEPLRERKNWVLDPDFDIGNPDPNWLSNGNGSQTDFWRANIIGSGTADHVAAGGQFGSVAIDLVQDNSSGSTELEHKKRVSFKGERGTFLFQIKYRTEGSIDALDHDNFSVSIIIQEEEFGGSSTGFGLSPAITLPRSATFTTVEIVHDFATTSNINWITFAIRLADDQGTADKLRIDSIQISSLGTQFGQVVFSGKTYPGLVPIAEVADQTLFLKGDGTYDTPSGSGVDSFNTRTGAVVPLIADYDGFFLTPAEGDAAYSLLAHIHSAFDRASSVLTGANVFSNIVVTDGIVTAIATRALTPANIGAAVDSHTHPAADIVSGTFVVARIPDLNASKITAGTFVNGRIAESNVTQHQAALTIVEGQITGAAFTNWNAAFGWGNHAIAGYMSDLADDTSPQLGADLSSNTFDIDMLDNDFVTFGSSRDVAMGWDGTQFRVSGLANDQNFDFIDGMQVRIFDGSESAHMELSHSVGQAIINASSGSIALRLAGGLDSIRVGGGGNVLSEALIQDGNNQLRYIGFADLKVYEIDVADTFDKEHNGYMWHKDAGGAISFTCADDSTIGEGAFWDVFNDDTETLTIAEGAGVTVLFLEGGAAPVAGDVSLAQGAKVRVYKYTDTEYWVYGSKDSPTAGISNILSFAWAPPDSSVSLLNQSAALLFFQNNSSYRTKMDLSGYTEVRMMSHMLTVGFAGSFHECRYFTSFSTSVGDYLTLGSSAVRNIHDSTGLIDTGWINLVSGAKIDNVFLALVMDDGNGVVDPHVEQCMMYFK